MVHKRPKRRTPSRVTRGGITALRVGKDDIFIFRGRKLKSGTVGIFGSKGALRVGVFQRNGKKTTSTKRRLSKRRRKSRLTRRSLK